MHQLNNSTSAPSHDPFPLQKNLEPVYASIESRFSTPPHILEPGYEAFIQKFLREISLYIEGSHLFSSPEQADLYLFVDQLVQRDITKYEGRLDPLVYTHIQAISSNTPIPFLGRVALDQKNSTPSPFDSLLSENHLFDEVVTGLKLLDKTKNELRNLSMQRRTLLFKLSKILIPLILKKINLREEGVALLEQLHSQDHCIALFLSKFRSVFKNEEENGSALDLLRRDLEGATEKDRFIILLLWILERTMWWSPDKVQALREAKKLSDYLDLPWQRDYRWTLFKTAFLSRTPSLRLQTLLDVLLANQAPPVYLLFFQELLKLSIPFPDIFTCSGYLYMPIQKQMPFLMRCDLHEGIYEIIQNFKEPSIAACRFLAQTITACHIPGLQTNHTMTTLLKRLSEAAERESSSLPNKEAIRALFLYFVNKFDTPFQNCIARHQTLLALLEKIEEEALRRRGVEVVIELLFEALKRAPGALDVEIALNHFFKDSLGESVPIFIENLFLPAQRHLRELLFSKSFYKKFDQWIQKEEEWDLLKQKIDEAHDRLAAEMGYKKLWYFEVEVLKRAKKSPDPKEEDDWIDLKTEEFVRLLREDALQITIEAELLSLQAMEDEIRKEAALAELARQEKKHKI